MKQYSWNDLYEEYQGRSAMRGESLSWQWHMYMCCMPRLQLDFLQCEMVAVSLSEKNRGQGREAPGTLLKGRCRHRGSNWYRLDTGV